MEKILSEIEGFYRGRFDENGPCEKGVGWRDREASRVRHLALLEGILPRDRKVPVTLHEIGCGIGHLKDLLDERGLPYRYSGSEVHRFYLEEAQRRHPETEFFLLDILRDPTPPRTFDYLLESGTFNFQPPSLSPKVWMELAFSSLEKMWGMCEVGIGFNFLTDRVEWKDPDLFYLSPAEAIRWVRGFTRRFVVRHDYNPFDFAVIAYREEAFALAP